MAIPSQAPSNGEGVETRRRPPKCREGHGEGIVQTTNPTGAAKAEVVCNQRVTGSIPVRLIVTQRRHSRRLFLSLTRSRKNWFAVGAYQNRRLLLSSLHSQGSPGKVPDKLFVRR